MRYAIIVCVVLVLCPRDRITENLDKGVKRGKVKGVWWRDILHSAHLKTHVGMHFRHFQTAFTEKKQETILLLAKY